MDNQIQWEVVDLRDEEPRRSQHAVGPYTEVKAWEAADQMAASVWRSTRKTWRVRTDDHPKWYMSNIVFGIRPATKSSEDGSALLVNGAPGKAMEVGV